MVCFVSYVLVVPLALINSCEGFAIGFSAMLPNYHPKDVIDNVRHLLDGEETVKMVPWYKVNLHIFLPKCYSC